MGSKKKQFTKNRFKKGSLFLLAISITFLLPILKHWTENPRPSWWAILDEGFMLLTESLVIGIFVSLLYDFIKEKIE